MKTSCFGLQYMSHQTQSCGVIIVPVGALGPCLSILCPMCTTLLQAGRKSHFPRTPEEDMEKKRTAVGGRDEIRPFPSSWGRRERLEIRRLLFSHHWRTGLWRGGYSLRGLFVQGMLWRGPPPTEIQTALPTSEVLSSP